MIRGFYTARSGLMSQQAALDIAANNLANVNTTGFKASKANFADLMHQNLNRSTAENLAQTGHGVKINATGLAMKSAAFDQTNAVLDYAITEENGFFAVENSAGDIQYTRAGNFIMSNDSDTFYLATANGDRVLDIDGSEIEIEFDKDGKWEIDPKNIGVYSFSNPYGLAQVGNNRFVQTDVSGEAQVLENSNLRNGYLEASGTEVSNEMVKVIEYSKAFSFNSRIVQIADEIEQTINQLR